MKCSRECEPRQRQRLKTFLKKVAAKVLKVVS